MTSKIFTYDMYKIFFIIYGENMIDKHFDSSRRL